DESEMSMMGSEYTDVPSSAVSPQSTDDGSHDPNKHSERDNSGHSSAPCQNIENSFHCTCNKHSENRDASDTTDHDSKNDDSYNQSNTSDHSGDQKNYNDSKTDNGIINNSYANEENSLSSSW
ncbi:hypothetical protein HPB47_002896, partial [Ixodes persulcatus]